MENDGNVRNVSTTILFVSCLILVAISAATSGASMATTYYETKIHEMRKRNSKYKLGLVDQLIGCDNIKLLSKP